MNRTYLIQRLQKPTKTLNPFSFGGGFKNGGLTDEAMSLISGIWSFDYMGAAEFEFGAVPEALRKIAKMAEEGELIATQFNIPFNKIYTKSHWPKGQPFPQKEPIIYLIGKNSDLPEIEERIRGFASKQYSELKEQTRLNKALLPVEKWDSENIGWLELDNGFMFFVDKTAFEQTLKLFGMTL